MDVLDNTVQNQPRPNLVLADCVRFRPNRPSPEASQCARIIWPASGQCFPAELDLACLLENNYSTSDSIPEGRAGAMCKQLAPQAPSPVSEFPKWLPQPTLLHPHRSNQKWLTNGLPPAAPTSALGVFVLGAGASSAPEIFTLSKSWRAPAK